MKSAIFSVLSSIVLTLAMRGPAPAPPPAPQPCPTHAAAQRNAAEAIPARVIEALRDSFPAWLAGQDIPGAAVAVVGGAGTLWHEEYGVTAPLEARRPLATAAGYAWGVSGVGGTAAGLLPDDSRVVCAWRDGTLKILDLETLREVGTLGSAGNERVLWLEISADGALAATARGATRIDAWRLADGELVFQHDFDSELVKFAWERGGRRLATGGPNEALSVWDIDGTAPPARFPAQVSRIAFHKGRIAAANDAGDVFLLELTGC
jgi:hypothetical protein